VSCPSVEALAAAAAGEHVRAAAHAEQCAECASLLAQQLELRTLARTLEPPRLSPLRRAKLALAHDPADEIRVLAQRLPAPVLDPARRAQLAADTLARADALPASRAPWFALGAIAMAAVIAVVVYTSRREPLVAVHWPVLAPPAPAPHAPSIASSSVSNTPSVVAPAPAPGPTPAPGAAAKSLATVASVSKGSATITGDADFTRDARDAHDTIQLRDGTLSVDARDRTPVAVAIGDTTIRVTNAHVEIRAAHGVIVSAHAFAGSVERTSPESKAIISAGEVWTPPPPEAALAAFRAGWSALHDGRNADALAAFERASDPVIAEEAAFWAAVAAQRANDREGAAQRFRAFLDAYPQSTRADAARAALQKLP
jgi:TolA-binding protein